MIRAAIGNHLFYFQTITERKIENKKLGGGGTKRFPLFLLNMYVFFCVFVCVFVCGRSTDIIV